VWDRDEVVQLAVGRLETLAREGLPASIAHWDISARVRNALLKAC
jgi:hypothetical protein